MLLHPKGKFKLLMLEVRVLNREAIKSSATTAIEKDTMPMLVQGLRLEAVHSTSKLFF